VGRYSPSLASCVLQSNGSGQLAGAALFGFVEKRSFFKTGLNSLLPNTITGKEG